MCAVELGSTWNGEETKHFTGAYKSNYDLFSLLSFISLHRRNSMLTWPYIDVFWFQTLNEAVHIILTLRNLKFLKGNLLKLSVICTIDEIFRGSHSFKSRSNHKQVRVKCSLVQVLRLCTGCTAHRGSRGIALLFFDHGSRRGWWVRVTFRLLFTPGKDPIPIVQEAGWAPGPVWTSAENLAPIGIRSPNRPPCSQSLYRLSYPTHES